jgi:putative DNA primase/helicase
MASEDFNLTDAGNAEFFTDAVGHELRYDHRRRHWLGWHEHRWRVVEDATLLYRAKRAMRERAIDALQTIEDDAKKDQHLKWAQASESRTRLDNLLYLARSEPDISDTGENWDSEPFLLGVRNGVVDLRTGEFRRGHREDQLTMQCAVDFNADVCPRWDRFLDEVFQHADLIDFIQRAVGYSLTGDTSPQTGHAGRKS